jgi:hypothetical protein
MSPWLSPVSVPVSVPVVVPVVVVVVFGDWLGVAQLTVQVFHVENSCIIQISLCLEDHGRVEEVWIETSPEA